MRTLLATGICLTVLIVPVSTGEPLDVRVTPALAIEPASMIVRTLIERDTDNRGIEVVAESGTFFRSSQMELAGNRASRVNEFRFRGFPAGRYEITVTLIGSRGKRAVDTKWFEVAPAAGK